MPQSKGLDYANATDEWLLDRYRAKRDQQAFAQLVERYYALVRSVAKRMLGCPHAAEDVVQATFLVLAKDGGRIRRKAALASWLYGVTYRIAARQIKRRAQGAPSPLQEDPMVSDDPLEKLCAQLEQQTTFEELHRLPESTRAPMVMRYLQGKSNAEVARSLSLSEAAVEGRLKRGRNQLRMRLARQGVRFAVVTTILAATRDEAKAESMERAHQITQVCFQKPKGTEATCNDVSQLAQEEIWKMTTTTLLKNTLAAALSIAVLATGWSLAGNLVAVAQEDGPGEVVIASDHGSDGAQGQAKRTVDFSYRLARNPKPQDTTGRHSVDTPSEGELKIRKALESPTHFEFHDTPLAEVVAFAADLHKIPVLLDKVGLEDEGLDNNAPISCELRDIRLKSAFNLALDEYHLTYVIKDEVLLITSQSRAEELTRPRVYRADSRWNLSAEELIDVITRTVAPDHWDSVGGPGSIVGFPGGIVISTTDRIHDQINELLDQIARVQQ